MNYSEFIPCIELKPFINCIWAISIDYNESEPIAKERLIPDGSLELIFHLKNRMVKTDMGGKKFVENEDILLGQVTKPYFINPTGDIDMIGVRFFPYTAHLFFDIPIIELNDTAINLDALWGSEFDNLKNLILEEGELVKSVSQIESFLMSKIKKHSFNKSDKILEYSSKKIMINKGQGQIDNISSELGVSNRYVQKVFKKYMGISPKYFAKIIRYQHFFGIIKNQDIALTPISYELGYFDQSHFIKDFKLFTGTTPQKYVKEKHAIVDQFMDPNNSSYLYNFF